MKLYSSNPKKLSIMATAIVVVVVWIIVALLLILDLPLYMVIITGVLVSAPLVYYFIFKIIDNFIYRKIKLIFKNIFKHKRGESKKSSDKIIGNQSDVLEAVNKQVSEWAKNQKDEIEELRRMAQYRREFLGNVSHELKTPIFNIQGYVLTLLDGGIDDPNINKKYLERTSESVNRMIAIVNDLETISSLESGVVELNIEKFDLVKAVKEVLEFLEIKAQKKNIKIKLAEEVSAPIIVEADLSRIKQVLTNLIDNAIKYSSPEDPEIRVKFYDMDKNILTEITDNGIGIKSHNINRVFERFYRVDWARSRKVGGTGLGLSIVKHIIEAHNQTINVRSKYGIGTTFGFTLKKANS